MALLAVELLTLHKHAHLLWRYLLWLYDQYSLIPLAGTQWPCAADTHPLIRGLLQLLAELMAELMASQPGTAAAGVAAAGAEAAAAAAVAAEAAGVAAAAAAGGARTAQAFEVTTSLLLPA